MATERPRVPVGIGACSVLLLLTSFPALAEVESVSANAFVVKHQIEISATPEQGYALLIQPSRWWSSAHTWSGSADNLRLEAQAGGCFCERWDEGEVEHLRVVEVRPAQRIRMRGALGPLASHAVDGVLEFNLAVAEEAGRTQLRLSYRISGDYPGGLEALAPAVDAMLAEQLQGLAEALGSTPDADG